MTIVMLGINLGKCVCSLAGLDVGARGVGETAEAGRAGPVRGDPAVLRGGDGGLFRGHYLDRRLMELGYDGAADRAAVRAVLCEILNEDWDAEAIAEFVMTACHDEMGAAWLGLVPRQATSGVGQRRPPAWLNVN